MESNCQKDGVCPIYALIVKFQPRETRKTRRIQERIPEVRLGQGNLYSVDFLGDSALYLVVVYCACVPVATIDEIKRLLRHEVTVDPGAERDEAVSFAIHNFAKGIGYKIQYTDVTVH